MPPKLILAALLLLTSGAPAQTTIRIWGHGHRGQDYILTLLHAWQAAFTKTHPDVRFDDQLLGDASGLAGLYTDTADLALLDREASFIEVDAYQQGTGYDPFRIPVAMGSVSTPRHAPALKLFVHPANPLTNLDLAQVDAIFDADHRRGHALPHTWSELGVTGPLASQPIHLYTYPIQSAEVQFFERAALRGSQKFSRTTLLPTAAEIIAATARDPDGLALLSTPAPSLKLLSIDGALPTPEAISAGHYPLARTVYLYGHRKPKNPLPPAIAAFMDFTVSPEGQAIVARTGGYLPLPPAEAAQAHEVLQ